MNDEWIWINFNPSCLDQSDKWNDETDTVIVAYADYYILFVRINLIIFHHGIHTYSSHSTTTGNASEYDNKQTNPEPSEWIESRLRDMDNQQ